MRIVWDEPKRLANLDKHGFDLALAQDFAWRGAKAVAAREGRYKAIGFVDEEAVAIVFTLLGEAICFISMRRASPRERKLL